MSSFLIVLGLLCLLALGVRSVATLSSASIKASVNWTYNNTVTGAGQPTSDQNGWAYSKSLTNGTGAVGTADLLYYIQSSIAASGNAVYDLAGSLTDAFGFTITMARVKVIYVNLTSTTTASSISFGNATNPIINWISAATSTVKIYNDGVFVLGSGDATSYAITAATADQFKVLNNDSSNVATVNVAFVGSSA